MTASIHFHELRGVLRLVDLPGTIPSTEAQVTSAPQLTSTHLHSRCRPEVIIPNQIRAGSAEHPCHSLLSLVGIGYASLSEKDRKRLGNLLGAYLLPPTSTGKTITAPSSPLRLVLALIDVRHEEEPDWKDLEAIGVPYLVVLTKCDRVRLDTLTWLDLT